jgi:HAD superfamily hydrolase (TIGR01490 family)
MKERIAFFDLDHTLLNVNSSFRFGVYLYRKKIINLQCLTSLLWYYFMHKCGRLDIYGIHKKSFESLFRNRLQSEFQEYAGEFVDECYSGLINQHVFDLMLRKRDVGEQVMILSSSPDFIVGAFAKRMGIELWEATIYQTNAEGRYHFIERVLEGSEKSKLVNEVSSANGISYENTSAYSDSHHDLAFLKSVANPVAVNPNSKLKKISLHNGWDILTTQ